MKLKSLKILEEGVYIFGGKNKFGKLLNTLIIMRIDHNNRLAGWFYPNIKGQLPPARFSHQLEFYPIMNSLLVYGGRDDKTG